MTETPGGDAPLGRFAVLRRDPAALTGLFVALVCLALAPGAIDNIDTRICFHSAQSFVHHGTFALVDPTPVEIRGLWSAQGIDGQWYSKFGIGVTLLLLPFTTLGALLGGALPFPTAMVEELLASLSSAMFVGVGAWAAVRIALDDLRVGTQAAVIGALSWAFCTYQFSYSGSSYLETPLGIAALLSVREALRAGREDGWKAPALCGFFAGLVVAIKVAMIVYLPFLLLPLLCRDRGKLVRRALAAGVPLAAWAGLLMVVNHTRFGSPFSTGYVKFSTLFETPLHVGLGGYLLDPDLALLLFAPAFGMALFGMPALWRRNRPLFWSAVGVFVTGTVIHALHTGYHGGTVYGPRYLISAIPLITFSGVALLRDGAQGARLTVYRCLFALFLAMQVPSVLVSPNEYHTIGARVQIEGAELRDLPPRVHYRLRPRLVVDALLFAKKLRGQSDRYDLRELIADPLHWPTVPDYVVPKYDRGFSVWWLLAAREQTRWALLAGALLTFVSIATGISLKRSVFDSPPQQPPRSPAPRD